MPTYKNITSLRQSLNGKVIEPSGVVHTTSYYNENEVKLLKIDDAPYYNPVLFSEVVTERMTIQIPEKDNLGERITKYAIHFFAEKGRVIIRYNSEKNDPPLYLYETAKWNVRCHDRTIDKIIIDSDENFVLNIIMEHIR